MPDVNNMFPSKWLKVGDLKGGQIDAVISHIVQEEIKQGEMLWVMHFHPNPQLPTAMDGTQPGAVLKTQNADAISTIYGPNTEAWSGQTVQLYVKNTNMGPGIGIRPSVAAFQQAHREEMNARKAEYRARKRGCTTGEMVRIKRFYKNVREADRIQCYYCGRNVKKSERHIDHIMPLGKGGPHVVHNLCCACRQCNQSKGGKTVEEWNGQGLMFVPDAVVEAGSVFA